MTTINIRDSQIEWVVFSCCDANYMLYTLTSLRCASLFLTNIPHKLVLVCSQRYGIDDDSTKLIAKKWGIELRHMDFEEKYAKIQHSVEWFEKKKIFRWPLATFYRLEMPQQFYQEGFKYSMFLDADAICVNMIDTMPLESTDFAMAAKMKRDAKINGGVLFFNNAKMQRLRLSSMIDDLITKGRTFYGDQQILDYLNEEKLLSVLSLPDEWNYLVTNNEEKMINMLNQVEKVSSADIKIYHLLAKPWRYDRTSPVYSFKSSFQAIRAYDYFHKIYSELHTWLGE